MPIFPDHSPDLDSGYENEPLLLEAGFGDGYYQNAGDGIRPYADKWNLKFSHRPLSVITEIKTFLDGIKGASFEWQSPLSPSATAWRYKSGYKISKNGDDAFTIEFAIEGASL